MHFAADLVLKPYWAIHGRISLREPFICVILPRFQFQGELHRRLIQTDRGNVDDSHRRRGGRQLCEVPHRRRVPGLVGRIAAAFWPSPPGRMDGSAQPVTVGLHIHTPHTPPAFVSEAYLKHRRFGATSLVGVPGVAEHLALGREVCRADQGDLRCGSSSHRR